METTDLRKMDVVQIFVNDQAIITFDALLDFVLEGTAINIDQRPQLDLV